MLTVEPEHTLVRAIGPLWVVITSLPDYNYVAEIVGIHMDIQDLEVIVLDRNYLATRFLGFISAVECLRLRAWDIMLIISLEIIMVHSTYPKIILTGTKRNHKKVTKQSS